LRHTIALTESSERALTRVASQAGQTPDEVLAAVAEALLGDSSGPVEVEYRDGVLQLQVKEAPNMQIRSTSGVMGGDASIGNTRIPVWALVQCKQAGLADERILANYPSLTASDLIAAWDYYAAHSGQVEAERRSHEEAA